LRRKRKSRSTVNLKKASLYISMLIVAFAFIILRDKSSALAGDAAGGPPRAPESPAASASSMNSGGRAGIIGPLAPPKPSASAARPSESAPSAQSRSIVGVGDQVIVDSQSSETSDTNPAYASAGSAAPIDLGRLNDINYLENAMYIVDEQTGFPPNLFSAPAFAAADLKIDNSGKGPKILIFHTHSQEMYSDSKDPSEGVMGAGDLLAKILESKYGIQALDYRGVFDMVGGQRQVMGAYERMEPRVEKLLADNPSIQLAIDIHRDGVPENIHIVTDINGRPTAQIMFVNGICTLNKKGALVPTPGLSSPYIKTNLALSFQLKLASDALYPNFTRKIYLNAWRYSTNMLPKSILVEVGANTNTKEEAFNAMEPLADTLAKVIMPEG